MTNRTCEAVLRDTFGTPYKRCGAEIVEKACRTIVEVDVGEYERCGFLPDDEAHDDEFGHDYDGYVCTQKHEAERRMTTASCA